MPDISSNRWQLPDGVDELLPEGSWSVELLRRRIVDRCHASGYELVMPPMVEYLDSLLTGTGETMDLQTFKLVDQQNGRTLGVRADMTPQVARIDAHALRTEQPNRLFYTGTVLRARTDGVGGSRTPQQFGAELFGHAGPESDIEIVRLMLDTVAEAGVTSDQVILDLGHVGIYRAIVARMQLDEGDAAGLFNAVQRGSQPDVRQVCETVGAANELSALLGELMTMRGDASILQRARQLLSGQADDALRALDTVQAVIDAINSTHAGVRFHIDLCELRGYQYHTGLLFAAYTGHGVELARGGRYDAVGAAFGRARPATGFSGDIKHLADIQRNPSTRQGGIFVDSDDVEQAWSVLSQLRNSGERVVTELPGAKQSAVSTGCDRQLKLRDGEWVVDPL